MIEAKAKELGRLIGQSSEYQAVKRASDALNDDKETVALLQRMEQYKEKSAKRAASSGQRDARARWLLTRSGTPTYRRLLVAQENFDKIMGRVNDWILEGIEKGASSPIITLG
jgi:cell fate (sporulation/competence/biofilm development) regulator YlbF (YheA/YmcA/DUF963 family)